jgi:phosphoadenosine phosphosulfate reductase
MCRALARESAVMLALIADVDPSLPIQFIDTGMHFPQTLDYRDELIERLGLTGVRTLVPNEGERLLEDPKNKLWNSSPDACCDLRKVRPLEPALEGYSAWITGRKRFHGGRPDEPAGVRICVRPLQGEPAGRLEPGRCGPVPGTA